jgi:hypothetical protein
MVSCVLCSSFLYSLLPWQRCVCIFRKFLVSCAAMATVCGVGGVRACFLRNSLGAHMQFLVGQPFSCMSDYHRII